MGEKDRLTAIGAFIHGRQFQSNNGFPPPAETGNQSNERSDQNYIAEWTHVVSAAMVLNARLSFGRFTQYFPANSGASTLTATDLGINMPTPPTVTNPGAPAISLESFSSIIGST